MAFRSNDQRDSSGRRITAKPDNTAATSKAKAKPESESSAEPEYVDGEIVRNSRVNSRRKFTDSIQNQGGTGRTYGKATTSLYAKIFRNGTPVGKPDQWSEEDQKRLTVGQHVTAEYIDSGDSGHYGIIHSVERGAADANARCNEDGTEGWWRKFTGYDWHEQAERDKKRVVIERPQTDDDADDSHLTEGQRLLKAHRAKSQSSGDTDHSDEGFIRGELRAFFGEQNRSSSEPAPSHQAEEQSSGGGFWGVMDWLNR